MVHAAASHAPRRASSSYRFCEVTRVLTFRQMLAVVPLMMLGLLAAACLLASAEWRSSETTSLLGSGEETAAAHVSAVRLAQTRSTPTLIVVEHENADCVCGVHRLS